MRCKADCTIGSDAADQCADRKKRSSVGPTRTTRSPSVRQRVTSDNAAAISSSRRARSGVQAASRRGPSVIDGCAADDDLSGAAAAPQIDLRASVGADFKDWNAPRARQWTGIQQQLAVERECRLREGSDCREQCGGSCRKT